MIKTPGDIARAALRAIDELEDPGPRLKELGRLYELYHAAHEEAKDYGYVGVGCITYAEEKLKEAQR